MKTEIDVFTSDEITTCATRLISAVNCCRADTIAEAVKEVRKLANSEYYDEQEMLHKIADFMESKLKPNVQNN